MGVARKTTFLLVVLLLVGTAAGLWYFLDPWFGDRDPGPPKAPGPKVLEWTQDASFRGIPGYLVPVEQGAPGKMPPLEEVWKGLYPGMTKDADTRKLMEHLFGGVPVEFVFLEGDRALPEAPRAARAVFLGVRPTRPADIQKTRHYPNGAFFNPPPPGIKFPMPDKVIDCLQVTLSWVYRAELGFPKGGPGGLEHQIDSLPVLFMAINEYLLRHRLGCQLLHTVLPGRKDRQSIVEEEGAVRARLEARIEEHRKRYNLPPIPR
jgi:hypothetical protein